MKESLAKIILDANESSGDEVKIYEGYSGRGMFGATTTAVTVEGGGIAALSNTIEYLLGIISNHPDAIEDLGIEEDELAKLLRHQIKLRADSMGLGTIIY